MKKIKKRILQKASVKEARAGLIPESDWTEREKQAEEKTAKTIKKQTKKRILSVTIKRMIDDSPDTSYLGEYSNTPETEFAIDRAHSEDCASVQQFQCDGEWAAWNGTAEEMLQRVREFLDTYVSDIEHESTSDGCPETCEDEKPYEKALDTVWDLEQNAGECDCHGGDMGRNEFRYFNPSFNYVTKDGKLADGLTSEEVRKYTRQDYERMERLNRGDWFYTGIRAEAKILIPNTWHGPNRNIHAPEHGTIQRLTSGGLWGIESDSDRAYLESVEKDELADLKQVLLEIGFSRRAISKAFKDVQRKD